MKKVLALTLATLAFPAIANAAENSSHFTAEDVFQLEYASSPTIHPKGDYTVFVRNYMDIMSDRKYGTLWRVDHKGEMRPLIGGDANDHSQTWSPDGSKLAFVSNRSGSNQIHLYWTDTRDQAPVTRLTGSPGNLSWSPDGKWLAFTMFTPAPEKPPVSLPKAPKGAEWAAPPKYIDKDNYRFDGGGYAKDGYTQIYVMPASGGTPRQLTTDEYNHGGQLAWSKDGASIIFSANLREDAFDQPANSELYRVALEDGSIKQLTDRVGPDRSPSVSPDGKKLAWLGYDDEMMSHQLTQLYVMDLGGDEPRLLTSDLDYSVDEVKWAGDSRGVYFSYDRHGEGHVVYQNLNGKRSQLTDDMGGLSYGRPYSGGAFDVQGNGQLVFTLAHPQRPADLMLKDNKVTRQLTHLNEDLFAHKELGRVEEIWYDSKHGDYKIQGWVVYPPDFDPEEKYPLILEIHGGPHTAYAESFSAEVQLMAAAGNVVLYTNPRGSTSYGEAFAQEIHHNYPSQDYDDLMDGVDAVIAKGFIDEERLYVTGGSGGGVLTAWIVGHTDRFAAAVVAKPVINWYSFVLTADMYNYFTKYWFPGLPWENLEHYMKYSPISYVGNVTTPTMLLTGEADYRTPISESEQYYQALKLAGVETAMVRVPDAPHGIYSRPSNLIGKVAYILHWFETH
ncbi:S9 family peptidase [Pseudidiomarina terrestris]|uniref:S9 family peptidase n=1 Tax=Pseudidiomarina terrestris TaxID=2820060 RepID=A0AAW7QW42_9GAMM|nr:MULTISPECIES: S9 family peptidase [unclassified Pseudidiomarina]MDN7124417.1 S9 family peptidase [Pseudidiomarina sp. 1APP75-32.1]MDN7129292.1 S9 family peptidase [Pseudidiomarina sp. 1APR75-15]MDN7134442.1 S9 family peptidase [Pseudidiomarina sp. 1ASP75-5]